MTTRAYSLPTVKSLDTERREIEGLATTPEVDRLGDVVEPMGARFTLPMPLLWQHKHDQPVGHVIGAKATSAGIAIVARLVNIAEPSELKSLVDRAWQSVKAGLVLSIIGSAARAWYQDTGEPIALNSLDDWQVDTVAVPGSGAVRLRVEIDGRAMR
jgi:hypothetical protein